jgi:ABC-type transport system involved in cytochrome c biogenesis permease subunit
MSQDYSVFDIMSFPWIGLLIVVLVLGFLLIGSYYATRWWIRSIQKDLQLRDLQKSAQNKKKKTE